MLLTRKAHGNLSRQSRLARGLSGTQTIDRRAFHFRNLVVLLVIVVIHRIVWGRRRTIA